MLALFWMALVLLCMCGVLWVAFRNSALVKLAVAMQRQVDRVKSLARNAHDAAREPGMNLARAARDYTASQRAEARARFPLEDLRPRIEGRVQWSALQSAGVRTLEDLAGASEMQLQGIHGVGPATAGRILHAARAAAAELDVHPVRLPGENLRGPGSGEVVAAALDVINTRNVLGELPARIEARHRALAADQRLVLRRITFLGWIFKSGSGEEHSDLMRDTRAIENEAMDYLDGEEVHAFRDAMSALGHTREGHESLPTLAACFTERLAEVHQLLRAALGGDTTIAPRSAPQQSAVPPPIPHPPRIAREAPVPIRTFASSPSPGVAAVPQRVGGSGQATWIPEGQEVRVAGHLIPGGMLYVGEHLPVPDHGYDSDPALIDPRLSVASRSPDWQGAQMRYWPSYSEIAPECRAAYLHWLAGGRREPGAYIGYVFLFFYGLERRVLRDAAGGMVAPEEVGAILREVERLLAIYGNNGSFRGYARGFADLLRVWIEPSSVTAGPPPVDDRAWELPLGLKRGLGVLVREGKPIPADWARAWILQHPDTSLRTPAERCPSEFARLFELRYRDRFGDGMILTAPKRKLTATYTAASSAFSGSQPKLETDVPDVSALRKPVEQLRELVSDCTDALDPYSRWLGRNSDGSLSLDGLSLLPPRLAAESSDPRIDAMARRLETALGGQDHGLVDVAGLFQDWPADRSGPMLKRDAVQRIRLLSALGFGIEPDVRFGGPTLSGDSQAVVFPIEGAAPDVPSEEYSAAALLLHLATVIAAADGEVSTSEEQHLKHHVETVIGLADSERRRLRAYMRWTVAEPPQLTGLTKRVRGLAHEQRELVGGFLVAVACADGRIDPDEVRLLTKVYRLLDLDPAQVHRELHQVTTGDRRPVGEPVIVRAESRRATGFAIPASGDVVDEANIGVELDMELVRLRMAETAAVSSLLGSIFTEEEVAPEPQPPVLEPSGALDGPHAGLLRALAQEATWDRATFEELAHGFGLLPEGALDVLNEAALDAVDELVCDGDDPIMVDAAIAEAVLT